MRKLSSRNSIDTEHDNDNDNLFADFTELQKGPIINRRQNETKKFVFDSMVIPASSTDKLQD
jgi:hypothetical protein